MSGQVKTQVYHLHQTKNVVNELALFARQNYLITLVETVYYCFTIFLWISLALHVWDLFGK
jgi:hypothetical protein